MEIDFIELKSYLNTFLCVSSRTKARRAPKTSDAVQDAKTPLSPGYPIFW